MIRAAIYARFSSDLQNDRSIDDQVALCRTAAGRAGFDVVMHFEDRALSGTSTGARAGWRSLMQAAAAGLFDVIVAEDVDRISRSQADWHAARKRLDFMGVKIHTPGGAVGSLDGSVRAMMAEHFIENLAQHTRRGMAGVIREGRSAGGRAYGYRPVPGQPGALEIVDAEAAIIRRIFDEYLSGSAPSAIVRGLNEGSTPPPRGSFWRPSTLLGSKARAHGILHNEVYAGRIVWNRVRMIRDPETGKRVSRVNPESEWQRVDAPHLRIVSDDVYKAAQGRLAARTREAPKGARKIKYLLSGLLRCGECGSGMQIKDRDNGRVRIQCVNQKHGGGCGNGRAYYLDKIEQTVIDGLKEQIGSKDAIAYFVRVYNDEQRRASADAINRRAKLSAQQAEAQRGLDRLIDAITAGAVTAAEAGDRAARLRQDIDAAKAALAATEEPPKVVSLHPAVITTYLRDLDRLSELISGDLAEGDTGLADAVRTMVETVTVMPTPPRHPMEIRIEGYLDRLLNTGGELSKRPPATIRNYH